MHSANPIIVFSLAVLPILACENDVDISANYNVITQTVTGTAKVKGKSQTRQIMIPGITPDANGCITIEDQDCGVVKICGGVTAMPVAVTITCGDPLLLQVPESWTPQTSTWANDTDGSAGALIVEDMSSYLDASEGATVLESGMKGLVVAADAVFPGGFDGTLTMALGTGGDDPIGTEIKGQDIIVVRFLDAMGNEVGTPEIAVALGQGAIDFGAGTTFRATIEEADAAEGSSGSEAADSDADGDAVDDEDDGCNCRAQKGGRTLAIVLPVLAGFALRTRRRRVGAAAR
jgi:hypothetical protein